MAPRLFALAMAFALLGQVPAQAQIAPNAAQVAQYTGLLGAAHRGDVAKLRTLLAAKPNMEVRDAQQRTPLHVATFAGQREAIRLLVAAGADLNAMDFQQYDAVTIASVADDEETLALLLQLGASAKNTTSPYLGTALIAAAHLGHAGVVRQLIAAGAPLDHVNNLHWTALIEAVVLGDGGARHTDVVRQLLAAGANPKLTDRSGHTPLQLAQARGYQAMVTLLQGSAKP